MHVVFGTGAIGLALIDELTEAGLPVRAVNRSGSGHAAVPRGVEVVGGDASDVAFATDAATGAATVYQCHNPPYHRWAELFPPLQDAVVAAAPAADASYASFENVYPCGDTRGVPMTGATPPRPHTRKGRFGRRWLTSCAACTTAVTSR